MIAQLIKDAGVRKVAKTGATKNILSEREIQYRIKLAMVYETDQQVRKLIADLGSWAEIIRAGFPEVDIDPEPDLLDELAASEDTFEQLSLIPGLGPTLSAGGRRVRLEDATVADVRAYRDMYVQIHENYGKKLALIEAALEAMEDGCDGDDSANALEAYRRGAA
jgi:hypothetical protein